MANITISVPPELKKELDELPETNWSEVLRNLLAERVRRMKLLKKFDEMLADSKLTEEDCLRLGEQIKESMWKKYKSKGW